MRTLSDDIQAEIRSQVEDGHYAPAAIVASILAAFCDELAVPQDEAYLHLAETDPETVQAVRAAVAEAVARHEADRAAWSRPTHCERLAEAFARLERQGIVALGHAGPTNDDARAAAIFRCVAWERAGEVPAGFCCFHEQDVVRAIEGAGLFIGFGVLPADDDDDDALLSKEAVVAQQVARELRASGLEVAWDGSPETRLGLPGFRWQHPGGSPWRVRDLSDSAGDLMASLEAEICARPNVAHLEVGVRFDDFHGPDALGRDLRAQRAAVDAAVEALLRREREREASWVDATDNDRLAAALASLASGGVVTPATIGTTLEDGWAYVRSAARPEHAGALFYHQQDVLGALQGEGLRLAFGAWEGGAVSPQRSVELATRATEALTARGLEVRWDGTYRHRLHLPSFVWRQRRWTVAPPVPVQPPKPRGLLSRLFAKQPKAVDFVPARTGAHHTEHVELHRALRDAGAYDLGLARRMRERGQRLGIANGQAASLGRPLCWLRTGEIAAFMVRDADDNLPARVVSEVYLPRP